MRGDKGEWREGVSEEPSGADIDGRGLQAASSEMRICGRAVVEREIVHWSVSFAWSSSISKSVSTSLPSIGHGIVVSLTARMRELLSAKVSDREDVLAGALVSGEA